MSPDVPLDWLAEQVKTYAEVEKPIYDDYAKVLDAILKDICRELAPLAIVQVRPKSVESFAEKAARRYPKLLDPVHQLTDLCGGRVIAHTRAQVRDICEAIKQRLTYTEEDDVSTRLGTEKFGYRSLHYLVRLGKTSLEKFELGPDVIRQGESADSICQKIGIRTAEVQVRTLLEHAWADVNHDRMYKTAIRVPESWKHDAYRQAALLENADTEFGRMVVELDENLSHYDAYLSKEQIQREIRMLQTVLECLKNPNQCCTTALRIAKLARSLGDWSKVVNLLGEYAERIASPSNSEERCILLEFGRALCEAHRSSPESPEFRRGQTALERVAEPTNAVSATAADKTNEEDKLRADALAALARSYEHQRRPEQEIRSLHRAATLYDRTNPYYLAAALKYDVIWQRDLSFLRSLAPQIRAARDACQAHVRARVALPQAFYAIGEFCMYLQDYYASLEAYAKAATMSDDGASVRAEYESLQRLTDAIEPQKRPVELGWILKFLRVVSEGRKLVSTETNTGAKAGITPGRGSSGAGDDRLRPPIVVLAGGADPRLENRFEGYEDLIEPAFEGFVGTVISGGTTTGIPGIMGAIAARHKARPQGRSYRLIAYRPKYLPDDAPLDRRYDEHIITTGETFSPLEPLRSWADVLAARINPREVRVLGINGGPIAAFEYHLALALGATVGVVEDSGRKAAQLLADAEDWSKSLLICLPADPMTLKAFVCERAPSQPELSKEQIERGGEEVHHVYEETSQHKQEKTSWDKVREDFKESSRQQVAFAPKILHACGFDLVPAGSGKGIEILTKEEVECMAEKEHGRWCVERLTSGWHLGPKDVANKISPYLVPWRDVPEYIKDYDREAVRAWPRVFRAMGFVIVRRER